VAQYRPSLAARAGSAVASIARWIAAGLPESDRWFARSCVCALCPLWSAVGARCLHCGCREIKHHIPHETCPLGMW
jgi:hypothetical protein